MCVYKKKRFRRIPRSSLLDNASGAIWGLVIKPDFTHQFKILKIAASQTEQ
jgi:hypothetical protein